MQHCTADQNTHCGIVQQIRAHIVALYSRSEHTLWHCTADLNTHCGIVQQIRAHTVALYSRSEHTLWHCTADQSTHCGTVQQIWTHTVALYSRSEHTTLIQQSWGSATGFSVAEDTANGLHIETDKVVKKVLG